MFRLLFLFSLVYVLGSLASSQNNSTTDKVSFGFTALFLRFNTALQLLFKKIAVHVLFKKKMALEFQIGH